jgi:transcriptional regulator with XRE-family HTH domain
MASIGGRLKEQRERAGLSLGQVGTYEGLTPQYLSGLEHGRNNPPTWDLLARLATRYECTTDYLLGLVQHPNGYAAGAPVSRQAKEAINLIDSLPPERRAAAVSVLRSILEFAEVGVPLPSAGETGENALPEPVPARQRGGVTNSRFAELGPQQILNSQKKDELLALLKKMVPPDVYEQLRQLVESGQLVEGDYPRTDAEIDSFLQSLSEQPIQDALELLDNEEAGNGS